MKTVGILALQGAYHAHKTVFESLDLKCIFIKKKEHLSKIDAITFPGGESTAIIYLLKKHLLFQELSNKIKDIPILATCAGIILLQKLGILDIEIVRNGYGGQLSSGIFPINFLLNGKQKCMDGYFIRAPIINKIKDPQIKILAMHENNPVLIQKNNILGATFHPELSTDLTVHKYFKEILLI